MRSLDTYQTNDIWGRATVTLAFQDSPGLHWRPENGYQFHHREPYGSRQGGKIPREFGGLMHFQFADRRRLLAKHALYKMQEVIRWPKRKSAVEVDALYTLAPNLTGVVTDFIRDEWIDPYRPLLHHLQIGAEPWQEAECRRLWAEHGAAKFAGLNLFGVIQ